jgi:DNA-binding Xre family transcriptional regulator
MRAFDNQTGFYTGDYGDDGRPQLWFTPGPFTEREPVPLLHRHSPNGIAWGYAGNGAADAARSILAHAAGAELAEVHYQTFKHEVIARLPVNQPFLLEVSPITTFLRQRGIHPDLGEEPFTTPAEARGGRPAPLVAEPSSSRERHARGYWDRMHDVAERERELDQREFRLDQREAAMNADLGIQPANSAPATPIRAQLLWLRDITGDSIETMAKGLDVEPDWIERVVDGRIARVDLDHIQRLCEALHCNPFDLWGTEVGRSLLPVYGPELWPADMEVLPGGYRDSGLAPPTSGPEPPTIGYEL